MTVPPHPDGLPKRAPATFVAGQRRRLVRGMGINRSNTTSVLDAESQRARLVTSASDGRMGLNMDQNEPPTSARMQRQRDTTDPILPVKDHLPTDFEPSTNLCLFGSSHDSLIHTKPSATKTTSECKKKHGLFNGLKLKDRDRSIIPENSPLPTSPLPPLTPSKAVQVLGLAANTPTLSSPRKTYDDSEEYGIDDAAPYITPRQTKFREESMEPTSPKTKLYTWAQAKKMATKMFDILSTPAPIQKQKSRQEQPAASFGVYGSQDSTNEDYRDDFDPRGRSCLLRPGAHSITEPRRMRRKGPKSLHRMSPITETSNDELRSTYRDSEHAPELEVISEYERDHPHSQISSSFKPHNAQEPATDATYELASDDLSSSSELDEEDVFGGEQYRNLPRIEGHPNQIKRQEPTTVWVRSPLQTIEDRLLDIAERDLEMHNRRVRRLDAQKLKLDTHTAALKVSHEKMKNEFEGMNERSVVQSCLCQHQSNDGSDESDDNDDLVSLRSSIDLDEEPTVHEAKAVTFTKVTPGMVKLVDIPPRKKNPPKSVSIVASSEMQPITLAYNVPKQLEIKPKGGTPDVNVLLSPSGNKTRVFGGRSENLKPDIDHPQPEDFGRHTKDKKSKMPRNESRLLVEDWINKSPGPKEQRPVSERIDLDVLADQQIPPAPFPKDRCVQ